MWSMNAEITNMGVRIQNAIKIKNNLRITKQHYVKTKITMINIVVITINIQMEPKKIPRDFKCLIILFCYYLF